MSSDFTTYWAIPVLIGCAVILTISTGIIIWDKLDKWKNGYYKND